MKAPFFVQKSAFQRLSLFCFLGRKTGVSLPHVKTKYWALIVVLLVGALLRFYGITWGMPSPDLPGYPSHPDEKHTLNTLGLMDVETRDLNPEFAHIEGTLAFYVWYFPIYAMRKAGLIYHVPAQFTKDFSDPAIPAVMLLSRSLMVLSDLLSVALIFFIVDRLTKSWKAAILAALAYALIPYQVIHSHFMRPHVLGNTFVLITIFLSILLYPRRGSLLLHAIVGFVVGLSMATRYHLLALVIIPLVIMFLDGVFQEQRPFKWSFMLKRIFGVRLFALIACIPIGFFFGDPYIFLDFASAARPLRYQMRASAFGEFTVANLVDFEKPLRYLKWVAPVGMSGLTWLFYASTASLFFCKRYFRYFVPLLLFSAAYWYVTTKGYGLWTVRTVLHVFPIFAIFTGLAFSWLLASRLWARRSVRAAVYGFIVLCFGVSFFSLILVIIRKAGMRRQSPQI